MDAVLGSTRSDRFEKLIDLSIKKRYCPHTGINWDEDPSGDMPWMPYELCTLFQTQEWPHLSESQRVRLSQLELVNLFSVTLAGEHEIQTDLMPLLFTPEYREESSYLSIFLREEYDHTAMFWKFCKKYRGDIYRAKHFRMRQWNNKQQQDLNSFVQTLIAEEILTYYNYAIYRSEDMPQLVRSINLKHHTDESRHIVMGRQMVEELWEKFIQKNSEQSANEYREYVRKYLLFIISSLAHVDVYRETGLKNALNLKIEFEKHISKNINTFAPARRLLDHLSKIDLYRITQ
jgi:hypothetical protein